MYDMTVLRNLNKILLVEDDPAKAKRQVEILTSEHTSVEVVEHEFQVLTRLMGSGHGYTLVFLGNRPFRPDDARNQVLKRWDLFEDQVN